MIKRFLKYLLIVCGGTLVLIYGIHALINNGFKKQQNDFFSIMNHVLVQKDNHEILALGASLTRNNISTQVLDSIKKVNSFNAGIFAFGLVETRIMLDCYLKSMHTKPKMILLTMPENLPDKPNEIVFPAQFYPYADNEIVYNTISKYDENIKLIRKVPFMAIMKYDDHLKYVALIPYLKPNHAKPNVYKGFDALEGTIKNTERFEKSTINSDGLFEVNQQQLIYFKDFCTFCHLNNIDLKVILTPTFRTSLNSNGSPMARLLKSYENSLHFTLLDFTTDSISLNKKMFYDRLHLNATGAKILTAKIANYL